MKTKSMFVYADQLADVCLNALRDSDRVEHVEHAYDVYSQVGKRMLEVVDKNGTQYRITVEAL
jgi:hypothetical protein